MAEGQPGDAAKTFETIAQSAHADASGAQTLTTLAKGAKGKIAYASQTPEALQAAITLAAQQRMAQEHSPMEKGK
jgi:hypothetical protein